MGNIKSRYTLAEAVEYLRRETGTPELSVHDIVTLAGEGKLPVCFSYKGELGLFKNGPADAMTAADSAPSVFGPALKTVYFNGVLRSLSRPAPDNKITDLRGHTRKAHTLHSVRVVPVGVFASDPPVELREPDGHHWRRVYDSTHSWAGAQLMAGIPEAEWMIEVESLHALATSFQSADASGSPVILHQQEGTNTSEPLQGEAPEQRQDRRLAWLQALGGCMKQEGKSWRTMGSRGLLAQLIKEEKAAGRPMSDKTDVRNDLIAATKRMRDGNTHSTMMGENSPEHPRTALEKAWGSGRGS
jgi:hypothetical protein